ncbi:MAG: hypothetical protein NTW86_05355 [Candidatus Sumerlaeota bacterium]|nr:hypothetical protein [Candidatus Sumerlaeota bacterium]
MSVSPRPSLPRSGSLVVWVLVIAVLVLGFMLVAQTLGQRTPPGPYYDALRPTPKKTATPRDGASPRPRDSYDKSDRSNLTDSPAKATPDPALQDRVQKLESDMKKKDQELKTKAAQLKAKDEEIEELRMRLIILESHDGSQPAAPARPAAKSKSAAP